MEENRVKDFKIHYDEEEDILYLAREGKEEEVIEISPGVNAELDASGKLMGVEIFKASRLFKDVIKVMEKNFGPHDSSFTYCSTFQTFLTIITI
jgi:uncharacterized protein YuzE